MGARSSGRSVSSPRTVLTVRRVGFQSSKAAPFGDMKAQAARVYHQQRFESAKPLLGAGNGQQLSLTFNSCSLCTITSMSLDIDTSGCGCRLRWWCMMRSITCATASVALCGRRALCWLRPPCALPFCPPQSPTLSSLHSGLPRLTGEPPSQALMLQMLPMSFTKECAARITL